MLKSIDVPIGLIVVLLALSMTVTVITQAITAMVNSRGRHLRRGLRDLLQVLDPVFDETKAKAVATRILTHPLVSGSNTPFAADKPLGRRLGNVVHREEFIKLLIGVALDPPPAGAPQGAAGQNANPAGRGQATDDVRDAVNAALQAHGVDPKATLEAIRSVSLQLERSAPELSNMARQSAAILVAAPNDFVAKINSWFDQTMDRTSQRFTASTRAITFVGAFLVAFGLQVDTPSLVNRLAADDALRATFVEHAKEMQAGGAPTQAPQGAPAGTAANTTNGGGASATGQPDPDKARSDADAQKEGEYRAFLAANGIIKLPTNGHWREGFTLAGVFGMLVTALLLSLGAPFWYSALSQLLQLRSVLAGKDDVQRAERQLTTEVATNAAVGTVSTIPPVLRGERGDLAALG